jgi:hypothetical protein
VNESEKVSKGRSNKQQEVDGREGGKQTIRNCIRGQQLGDIHA